LFIAYFLSRRAGVEMNERNTRRHAGIRWPRGASAV
jgi:hypothetical protein